MSSEYRLGGATVRRTMAWDRVAANNTVKRLRMLLPDTLTIAVLRSSVGLCIEIRGDGVVHTTATYRYTGWRHLKWQHDLVAVLQTRLQYPRAAYTSPTWDAYGGITEMLPASAPRGTTTTIRVRLRLRVRQRCPDAETHAPRCMGLLLS